jgi:hypothetical protein
MFRRIHPAALIGLGIVLGAISIWTVSMRAAAIDYRAVDIITIFAGGMISGAALASGLMGLRRNDASA